MLDLCTVQSRLVCHSVCSFCTIMIKSNVLLTSIELTFHVRTIQNLFTFSKRAALLLLPHIFYLFFLLVIVFLWHVLVLWCLWLIEKKHIFCTIGHGNAFSLLKKRQNVWIYSNVAAPLASLQLPKSGAAQSNTERYWTRNKVKKMSVVLHFVIKWTEQLWVGFFHVHNCSIVLFLLVTTEVGSEPIK